MGVSSCNYNKSKGVGTVSSFTDVAHTAGQMRALLVTDQSLSPLRPTRWLSNHTPAVSSPPDAEPTSITVSSPSDMEPSTDKISSSSRTLGDHHGEIEVTLESEPPTNAVSSTLLPTHPHEWK